MAAITVIAIAAYMWGSLVAIPTFFIVPLIKA
jgi:hypothetical protein